MNNKKFGLGKGLGALIPDDINEDVNSNSIFKVSINLIKPNEDQPRKKFDEDKIIQLSESIKEHGIIQPIVLAKQENTYTIIAGERRWRAAKVAGIKEVPAVIMNLVPSQILEVSLIENIQREDLNPIEEALAYKKLIEDFKITQDDLGKRLGKSRVGITNSIRLLKLDKRVQDYIIDGVISEGHGRAILGIDNPEIQYKIAQEIIDNGLSVRETEKMIKSIHSEKEKKAKKNDANVNIYYNDIRDKLENYFGTKVNLNVKKNKGKIQIEYYSQEDLERILNILNIN